MRATISKQVYDRYPETKLERTCLQEKKRLDELRRLYKKRLIEKTKEKVEYK